jgi:hypothetical protein
MTKLKIKNVEFQNNAIGDPLNNSQGFGHWQVFGRFNFTFEGETQIYSIWISDISGGCGPASLFRYPCISSEKNVDITIAMIKYLMNLSAMQGSPFIHHYNYFTITQGWYEYEDDSKYFRKELKKLGFHEHLSTHARHSAIEDEYFETSHDEFQSFFVLNLDHYYKNAFKDYDGYLEKLEAIEDLEL